MTKEQLHKYVSESTRNESNICQIYAILDYLGGRSGITGEFRYATLGIQILAGISHHKN